MAKRAYSDEMIYQITTSIIDEITMHRQICIPDLRPKDIANFAGETEKYRSFTYYYARSEPAHKALEDYKKSLDIGGKELPDWDLIVGNQFAVDYCLAKYAGHYEDAIRMIAQRINTIMADRSVLISENEQLRQQITEMCRSKAESKDKQRIDALRKKNKELEDKNMDLSTQLAEFKMQTRIRSLAILQQIQHSIDNSNEAVIAHSIKELDKKNEEKS